MQFYYATANTCKCPLKTLKYVQFYFHSSFNNFPETHLLI